MSESETLIKELTKTPEGMRLYQQERLTLDITEKICEIMKEHGVSRAELARFLDGQTAPPLASEISRIVILDEDARRLRAGWRIGPRIPSRQPEGVSKSNSRLD